MGQPQRTHVHMSCLKPSVGGGRMVFLSCRCFQLSLFAGPALWPWPHPDRWADQYSDRADPAQQDNQRQSGAAGTAGEERSCSWAEPPTTSVGSQPLHSEVRTTFLHPCSSKSLVWPTKEWLICVLEEDRIHGRRGFFWLCNLWTCQARAAWNTQQTARVQQLPYNWESVWAENSERNLHERNLHENQMFLRNYCNEYVGPFFFFNIVSSSFWITPVNLIWK